MSQSSLRRTRPPTTSRDAPQQARPGTRKDARALLLDAAERLFAERGIQAVSLREIAAEAGQKNNSAVGYHFHDKRGLLDALIDDRIGKVEQVRRALIEKTADLSRCDAAALLKLIWQPLVEIDAKRDRHYFVQFQLAYQVQNERSDRPTTMDPVNHPASGQIMAELEACFSHVSPKKLRDRIRLVSMMFWGAVSWHDHIAHSQDQRSPRRFSIDDTIKLAVAALAAPA
jgi:TetR/AcrR family transcriptional regulator, regulator of cefoperazone and chloramphenicol sensitivity